MRVSPSSSAWSVTAAKSRGVASRCRVPPGSSTELAVARAILHELNRRTFKKPGRGFPPTDSNLKLILARMRDTDMQTVAQVTVRQILKWWHDTDMEEYLRPATIYGAKKFSQYAGQVGTPLRRKDGRKLTDVFTKEQLELISSPFNAELRREP